MNEFDIKAAEWDNNPMHWERSEAIVNEIIKLIPLSNKMTALEYGAGTGI
jgi:16S rRNA A1518/A1519 N6-dimethyltransferase RsmA/KsgA/DIM1 with predicted DNA glycosylase/AP lyase activity